MLPTDALNTLKALSLNERPLITPLPDKDTGGKSAFEVGQKVQGAIQAEVSPGVFKVRVLEQTLHMQLPTTLKSGDVVELQVMSLQPRLTFSLSASSNPLSTPEQLSGAARLLSSLSQQPLEKSYVRAIQSTPLWAAATKTPDTTALAVKLQESLSQSGLFYESHQAQWIAGARSTAQLLQEPQNKLTDVVKSVMASLSNAIAQLPQDRLNQLNDAVRTAMTSLGNVTARLPQNRINQLADAVKAVMVNLSSVTAQNRSNQLNDAAKTVMASLNNIAAQLPQDQLNQLNDAVKTMLTSLSNVSTQLPQDQLNQLIDTVKAAPSNVHQDNTTLSIPNQLQPLVQQQLNALETRQIFWQGLAWPNQQMDWEIHEEASRHNGAERGEATGLWATQIRLDLPNLGEVAAMLRFGNNGLSITLDAAEGQTRALLGNTSSQLTAALSERGIEVSSTLVASHEKPG